MGDVQTDNRIICMFNYHYIKVYLSSVETISVARAMQLQLIDAAITNNHFLLADILQM